MSRHVGSGAWADPADEPDCDEEPREATDREATRDAMRRARVRAEQQDRRQS